MKSSGDNLVVHLLQLVKINEKGKSKLIEHIKNNIVMIT